MDTFDQVKKLMLLGCGKPPMEPSVICLLNMLTLINEGIANTLLNAKSEEDFTRQDFIAIEGDVLSMILGCEEWMRLRYEVQFKGRTLSEESIDRLKSQMMFKRMMDENKK